MINQETRLRQITIRRDVMQQRRVMPVHVIRIHAAREEKRGGVRMLEVVIATPLRHLRYPRTTCDKELEHRVIPAIRWAGEQPLAPVRSVIGHELRVVREPPIDSWEIAVVNQVSQTRAITHLGLPAMRSKELEQLGVL